jgi:UDP-galactose transporter B1
MITLLASVSGIYAFFLTWSVLQERISTTPYGENGEKFTFFVVLNGIQAIVAALVAYIYLRLTGRDLGRPSWGLIRKYGQAAFTNAIASPFGYASLKHIDYPTLILGKSCKLIPVMFVGFILYGKRYPIYKYISVMTITIGVSTFMLLQPVKEDKSKMTSSLFGLGLLLINLLLDGATNSTQDQIFHQFKVSGQQMMCFMNLFGGLYMLIWFLHPWNNELWDAIQFCSRYPNVIKDILIFSFCGSLGQCFIFFTLARFGSLVLVTVTVTRKMFSMLLSVFWFGHQLNLGQWLSIGMVFIGIGLDAYMKSREKLANTVKVTSKSLVKGKVPPEQTVRQSKRAAAAAAKIAIQHTSMPSTPSKRSRRKKTKAS